MSLNGVVEGLLSVLLSWMRIVYNWFWSMLATGGQGQFMPWFSSHWIALVAILIALGVVVDYSVYLSREKPQHAWIRTLQKAKSYVTGRSGMPQRGGYRRGLDEYEVYDTPATAAAVERRTYSPIDAQTGYVGDIADDDGTRIYTPTQHTRRSAPQPSPYISVAPDSAYADAQGEYGTQPVIADDFIYETNPADAQQYTPEHVRDITAAADTANPLQTETAYQPRYNRPYNGDTTVADVNPAYGAETAARIFGGIDQSSVQDSATDDATVRSDAPTQATGAPRIEVKPAEPKPTGAPRLNVKQVKPAPYGLDYDDETE